MLVIVEPDKVSDAIEECTRLGLRATLIGNVTDTGRLTCTQDGEVVADVPAESLGDGPVYHRPYTAPAGPRPTTTPAAGPDIRPELALLKLIGCANICSKRWVWEQYDYQVMLNTVAGPGIDAAILRLPGTQTRIAVTVDGNGRYGQIDPREGARHSVAEAYRNLCIAGAEPVAVTNCMNFGNPEVPEVMWQFVEAVQGMGEACRELETPITGGNVSFYNQTLDEAIYPTPMIGMIGIVKPGVLAPPIGFQNEEDAVFLLGRTKDELGAGEYQRTILGKLEGPLPELDLNAEASLGWLLRELIARELLTSAHDCSEGGVGVALAEMAAQGRFGAEIRPEPGRDLTSWLFSETTARAVVTVGPGDVSELKALAKGIGSPITELGLVKGKVLLIRGLPEIRTKDLKQNYEDGFGRLMGAN
jgi:phosphoribosylformylglycinamidine synthase